ncbi:MAG: sigma-70 family RNA polymerase sigma factor [Sedimentisphaerales bacterium]|nr:sigma-70 family RNA polymerase sigma factor [Sedimentisphaerales bacterium]
MKSDRELVNLANQGDPDAFETLYYRYRDWVYRLAWRWTGNQADALDVLQETFTYLLGKFPGFELTASMTTFLYPAVKHISTTMCTKKRRFSSDNEDLSQLTTDQEKPIDQGRSELAVVLSILPDEQREILLMRFVDDMRLAEIADALDIPLSTIKSRLYHALDILRNDKRTRNYFLE